MANTQLANQNQTNTGITTYLSREDVKKNVLQVLGNEQATTRFISSIVSAVQANPKLAECTNGSILSAGLQGEALNLAPSPQLGQFYMVPYDNNKKVNGKWVKVKEAQFQIGYKGYIQLAIRSGQYKKIVVSDIRAGECKYNPITEDVVLTPIMDPAKREETPIVGYFAMFELMNGFIKELYTSREEMEHHARKYSSAYRYDLDNNKKGSKWTTDFDDMAQKTMIRKLISKWGIMSIEMQQAFEKDMAVLDENGNPEYVDNNADIEATVAQDISNNANTEEFVEAPVDDVVDGDFKEVTETQPTVEPPKEEKTAQGKQKAQSSVPDWMNQQ